MTAPEPFTKAGSVFCGDGRRLIRITVANSDGGCFHALTFRKDEIQGVEGWHNNSSALLLRSGLEIPVALSYEDLEQRLYTPNFRADGPVLELRDVTGPAVLSDASKRRLAAATNQAPAPTNTNQAPSTTAASVADPGDKMPDANDQSGACEPRIGAVMPDGTLYAGISPDTRKPMYAMSADLPLTMTFNEAKEYAAKLDAHGHNDWHVPTKNELNLLFNNRAAIGGLNASGAYPSGWYWSSSSPYSGWGSWGQRFSDGWQYNYGRHAHSSVRLVR